MNVINAFSDETTAKLTGLTVGQLRAWDRDGFFVPSLAQKNRRLPYSRIYNFSDVAALRVIASLRNKYGVSLQHLKKVASKLAAMGENAWVSTTLYVLNKRVVFDDPKSGKREEIVSGQRVFEIPLSIVVSDLRSEVETLSRRNTEDSGKLTNARFVMNGETVVKGTRIPVRSILAYLERGLPNSRILEDYPDLTNEDLEAVRRGFEAAA